MATIPSPNIILPVSDRVVLVQGTPPRSPAGIARIAMIGGVPSVSINGGAYASFGTGGAAPSGTNESATILPVSDRIDIIQGTPPRSPIGCGSLAVIGGVASLSVEGAAFASLGVTGSASAGSGLFPGYLSPAGWIDIVQGNPPVSRPGTARIACFPGATSLSISIEGAAYVTLGVTPPGTPSLWFDGQNMDGTNNSSMVDAQAIGTWVNPGSLGAGGNAVQATAGSKPTFRLIATPGKINNKSAAESIDTLRSMATAAFASQNQPYVVAAVFRNNNAVGVSTVLGSSAGGMKWYSIGGTQQHLEVSAVGVTSSNTPTAGQWHMITGTVNGASSEERVDAVSTLGTCGGTAFGTIATLFDSGAGQNMQGFLAEALFYFGALPSLASIETYFTSKYGAFPQ